MPLARRILSAAERMRAIAPGFCRIRLPSSPRVTSKRYWTMSLKLRRIDWNLAGVGLACSAVRAPGQGADQVAGDAPAQGGDRPGAMAGRADRGAGFRGVGVRGAEGGKGFARERGSRRPPGNRSHPPLSLQDIVINTLF